MVSLLKHLEHWKGSCDITHHKEPLPTAAPSLLVKWISTQYLIQRDLLVISDLVKLRRDQWIKQLVNVQLDQDCPIPVSVDD